MCCRLSNNYHCLTFLTILGFLQVLASIPITVLSFLVFFLTDLGILLSPFWCGLTLLITGLLAVLIRPTRLAFVICFHVVLNSICIVACIVAGGLAGLYGTAIYLPTYNSLTVAGSGSGSNILCIFSQQSQLYSDEFRIIFRPLDSYVPSCNDLSEYWTYLIAIMSLCFVGCVISVVAIFTNCITPCVEDRYSHSWRAKTPES